MRLSQGESVGMAAKSIGVTEQTYYRWRKEYGGLPVNQAKRLKDMEKENTRLRKAISDLMLDKQILEEVIKDPKGSAAKSSKPLAQAPSSQSRDRGTGCFRTSSLSRGWPISLNTT